MQIYCQRSTKQNKAKQKRKKKERKDPKVKGDKRLRWRVNPNNSWETINNV